MTSDFLKPAVQLTIRHVTIFHWQLMNGKGTVIVARGKSLIDTWIGTGHPGFDARWLRSTYNMIQRHAMLSDEE
jgi:hypothetical protein